MKLNINLQNCYGIDKLQHEIDYSNRNVAIIYAPNGMMKTSLTRTFENIKDGVTPKDLHNPNRQIVCDIKNDDTPITPELIYVFKNEDYDGSSALSSFLARKDLKDKYEKIYEELNESKSSLTRELKTAVNGPLLTESFLVIRTEFPRVISAASLCKSFTVSTTYIKFAPR